MEQREVVVVRQSDLRNGTPRVAEVLARDGKVWHVRWEDTGEEELVELDNYTKHARRGSLRFRGFVDPKAPAELLAKDPIGTVVLLLRDNPAPMTLADMRRELIALGCDQSVVDAAMKVAAKRLATCDEVAETQRNKKKAYQWIGPTSIDAVTPGRPPLAPLQPATAAAVRPDSDDKAIRVAHVSVEQRADAGNHGEPPSRPFRLEIAVAVAEASAKEPAVLVAESDASADEPKALVDIPPGRAAEANTSEGAPGARHDRSTSLTDLPEVEAGGSEASSDEPTDDKRKPLPDRIAEVLGDEQPKELHRYAAEPLRVATGFGKLDAPAIDRFLAQLSDEDRIHAEALLLALPRRLPVLDSAKRRQPLAGAVVAAVLAGAVTEIRHRPGLGSAQHAVAWLVRRACAVEDLPVTAVAPLVDLIGLLGPLPKQPEGSAIESAAGTLARLLPKFPPEDRATLDVSTLARAVVSLPLDSTSGRAALLAAVANTRPDTVTGEMWWRGATLDEIARCATGILGGVTSRPAVAEQVVRPLVVKELSAATSRTRLAFLLGLPREFVAGLPADVVAAAFRRVAAADEVTSEWLTALNRDDRVEALQEEVERARASVLASTEVADAAARRAVQLAERCDRLEEALRVEHAESASLRSAQDRQIQIDIVRVLADLAAEVEELATNNTEPGVLVERTRALVASQALEPIGLAGDNVAFDPTQHDPIVGTPAAGESVTVIRPGYRWRPSGEAILIDKALVTTE